MIIGPGIPASVSFSRYSMFPSIEFVRIDILDINQETYTNLANVK